MRHRRKVGAAAGLTLAGAGAALLLLTGLHAALGNLAGFDLGVQRWVHGFASPGLDGVMLALTGLGAIATIVPAVAFVVAMLALEGRRRWAWVLGLAMVGAMALNEGLKLHFHRARPAVAWAIGDEKTYSFPSGHALFATVLYGTATYLAWRGATAGRRAGLVVLAAALALAIGVSRVYLGMHWPTDLLAGYAVGLLWLGTVAAIDRMWQG